MAIRLGIVPVSSTACRISTRAGWRLEIGDGHRRRRRKRVPLAMYLPHQGPTAARPTLTHGATNPLPKIPSCGSDSGWPSARQDGIESAPVAHRTRPPDIALGGNLQMTGRRSLGDQGTWRKLGARREIEDWPPIERTVEMHMSAATSWPRAPGRLALSALLRLRARMDAHRRRSCRVQRF